MTDLETRVREALHADPGAPSADTMLDDVRRGVSRRRARRTTGVVVAAAVVAAVIGGTALQRHHSPSPTTPPPSRAGLVVGPVAVSVTPAGEAFTVSANQGCAPPCSTIWKQDSSGSRTRLVTLTGKDAQYFGGLVIGIAMSPGGRDGWAWGEHLYATHDGGRTWTTVTSGPGADPPTGELDLIAGPDTAWAITRTVNGARLWRTPVGQDAWVPAHLPTGIDPSMTFLADVLPHSRVAILSGQLCGSYLVGDGSTWKHVTVPRFRVPPQFGGKTFPTFLCGPAGDAHDVSNGADNSFALSTVVVGTTPSTRSDPVGQVEELWVHGNRAILVTPTGVSPADLHLGAASPIQILAAAHAGDHAWIVTSEHRLFSSDDGGHHWVSRP